MLFVFHTNMEKVENPVTFICQTMGESEERHQTPKTEGACMIVEFYQDLIRWFQLILTCDQSYQPLIYLHFRLCSSCSKQRCLLQAPHPNSNPYLLHVFLKIFPKISHGTHNYWHF